MNCSMDTSIIIQCDECESSTQRTGVEEECTASPAGEQLTLQLELTRGKTCFHGKKLLQKTFCLQVSL